MVKNGKKEKKRTKIITTDANTTTISLFIVCLFVFVYIHLWLS